MSLMAHQILLFIRILDLRTFKMKCKNRIMRIMDRISIKFIFIKLFRLYKILKIT